MAPKYVLAYRTQGLSQLRMVDYQVPLSLRYFCECDRQFVFRLKMVDYVCGVVGLQIPCSTRYISITIVTRSILLVFTYVS